MYYPYCESEMSVCILGNQYGGKWSLTKCLIQFQKEELQLQNDSYISKEELLIIYNDCYRATV